MCGENGDSAGVPDWGTGGFLKKGVAREQLLRLNAVKIGAELDKITEGKQPGGKRMEQYYRQQLECLCKNVRTADEAAKEASRRRWDGIAKPIGGLGLLEDMITRIAGIRGTEEISLDRKGVVIFCADNGVAEEGVTQTDSSVTAVVTENFAKGIASVNRMAFVAGAANRYRGGRRDPGTRSADLKDRARDGESAPGEGNDSGTGFDSHSYGNPHCRQHERCRI